MRRYKLAIPFVFATWGALLAAFAFVQSASADPPRADAIADPQAYCARIGTVDVPRGGGSPIPGAIEARARAAVGLSADAPLEPGAIYWRCMGHAVYVCATGANIPCASKAKRERRNVAAEQFCREHRDVAVVPAYVTGHDTLYDWSCVAGDAVRGKAVATLDGRGYRADIWHRLDEPAAK